MFEYGSRQVIVAQEPRPLTSLNTVAAWLNRKEYQEERSHQKKQILDEIMHDFGS
jgi:hypothetical protein